MENELPLKKSNKIFDFGKKIDRISVYRKGYADLFLITKRNYV